MQIRRATIDDIEQMSLIHKKSWQNTYKGMIPKTYLENIKDDHWEKFFKTVIQDNTMISWVAEQNSKLLAVQCIGDSVYDNCQGQLELISIYILPEYKRQKIGTKLIEKIKTYAKDKNYPTIGLWVLEQNIDAQKFYEKQGFKKQPEKLTLDIAQKQVKELRYTMEV